jgi:hypothetical protein
MKNFPVCKDGRHITSARQSATPRSMVPLPSNAGFLHRQLQGVFWCLVAGV